MKKKYKKVKKNLQVLKFVVSLHQKQQNQSNMETNTVTAKVKRIIKKGYSFYGNPHYTLILETLTGTEIECKTVVNGSIGYGLTNYLNRYGIFTYHETARGNIILDFAKDAE